MILKPISVLVRGSITVIKHYDQQQLREEMGYFTLELIVHHPKNSGQEPRGSLATSFTPQSPTSHIQLLGDLEQPLPLRPYKAVHFRDAESTGRQVGPGIAPAPIHGEPA